MKLAHVSFNPCRSVYNKIVGQAKAAKELGFDFEFIVLSNDINKKDENIKLFKLDLPSNNFLRKMAINFFRFRTISKSVDLTPYDRIILRYPNSVDPFYKNFFKKYENKIITEHQTNAVAELKTQEVGFLNPLRIFLEKKNSPKLLSKVVGIIGVTDEIRRMHLDLAKQAKPSIVIPNGIDVRSITFTKFKPVDNSALNIIFVSSIFEPWHGLDRLLRGLMQYDGYITIKLFLVGNIYRSEELKLLKSLHEKDVNIHIMGELYGAKLDKYYIDSNVAVSSLALFRNEMNEGCVLKTREYITRGIPFIYAYNDVDIEDDCAFALKVDNCNDPIDIQKIIQFAERVSKIENLSENMREYAARNLDWKNKIKEMHQFALKT
ncbi:MAG: glycosyltransferase family 4 protein [Candidatus Aminicenantes bacterium]|nr:MAG: glycosyltransferase family 4 protein [Candidatus Aminicenantes bacterium]